MDLSWIDEYVDGIIDYCYSRNIFEIYKTLNMKINKVNKDNIILQNGEAMYLRSYNDLEVVFLREDLHYEYEKFVLAHELGHAILHINLTTAAYHNKLIIKGKYEHEADYFALRLLDISIDEV